MPIIPSNSFINSFPTISSREIGAQWEYANLGYGLLWQTLPGVHGSYRLKPGSILIMMGNGNDLFAQSDAERYEIFPEGEWEFFSKAVDARITFEVNETGRAASLTLHDGGQDISGPRIIE